MIEMEYAGEKVTLRCCPFCGSEPLIRSYKRHVYWFRIRCGNEREICTMIPETTACRTLAQAAADWNMRPPEE